MSLPASSLISKLRKARAPLWSLFLVKFHAGLNYLGKISMDFFENLNFWGPGGYEKFPQGPRGNFSETPRAPGVISINPAVPGVF